jgi:SEC-C motif-containing protein
MTACPCGSGTSYADCCEPLINGEHSAQSAEALMRSRYSAYVNHDIDYVYNTLHPEKRHDFNRKENERWAGQSEWVSLEILRTENGMPQDRSGVVEFIARYRQKNKPVHHHEVAQFVKEDDQWYFWDGTAPKIVQAVRKGPKTGRNDKCVCGSGKKYKKCCAQ